MTELELIIDLHKGTKRQGPGSTSDTLKALSFMDLPTNKRLEIADIGCGTGGQSVTLAHHLDAHITAVDLFPDFVEEVKHNAFSNGLSSDITPLEANMYDLPFEEASLDMIWAEGAIYNIGFQNGIERWKKFLKPGGYIAVSEITWIKKTPPKELSDFWESAYAEISSAGKKLIQLEGAGYNLCGYFFLPQESWINHYYTPLEAKFPSFLAKHNNSALAQQVVEANAHEIALYKKYKEYYSYGFYIAQKA